MRWTTVANPWAASATTSLASPEPHRRRHSLMPAPRLGNSACHRRNSGLKTITTLGLSKNKITDAGVKELADLENLATLLLDGTQITDESVKELAKLKNLTTLVLRNTKVTNAGVKELQKALPNCKINK